MTTTIHDTTVSPTFDQDASAYHVYWDAADPLDVCTKLVFALCSLTNDEPTDLLPIYHAVNPDALESHVRGRARGVEMSFEYENHYVTVRDDGRISLSPEE